VQASSTDVYVASSATGETALPSVQSSAAAATPSDTSSDDENEEEEEDCDVQYVYDN